VTLPTASSCIIEHRYEQLSEEDKSLYDGTQSGYHRLSEFFATRVKNDAFRSSMSIYHHADGKDASERIGKCRFLSFDVADYGMPVQCFMVSKDGRTLLYQHDGGLNKPNGLYRYRHSEGDRLLLTDTSIRGGNREMRTLDVCPRGDIGVYAKCREVSADDQP
jgi:hypothetical protein